MGPKVVFSFLTILGITLLWMQAADALWLDVNNLAEDLGTLKNKGLGVQTWQNYLDKLDYSNTSRNGAERIKEITDGISQKFAERLRAIRRMKDVIVNTYDKFTTSSIFKRCCELKNLAYSKNFHTGVDENAACYREFNSKTSSTKKKYATRALFDVMKENMKRDPTLMWQYFGSEEGVLTVYPANEYMKTCGTLDPRLRPWYVESSTPIRKKIVVVIDHSRSMREESVINGPSLMDIAKEAASTVLDTLAPHDLVGVVKFNHLAETLPGCYNQGLAAASGYNLKILKQYVQNLLPEGQTSYMAGLELAFGLLKNTSLNATDDRKSETVILFLTDGEPKETKQDIIDGVKRLQAEHNNTVTIFTYGLGDSLARSAVDILQDIADVSAPTRKGVFHHVTDPSKLRNTMAFYYNRFRTNSSEAILTAPYPAAFGLGMMTTVALPVYYGGNMIGVLGIDLPLNDLFSNADFQRHYLFVIDMQGRTRVHPLLTAEGQQMSNSINIETLERNKEAKEVIASMKRGETNQTSFVSDHLLSRGDPYWEGVGKQNLMSTYYWRKVPNANFSVCLVMVTGDAENVHILANSSEFDKSAPFNYYRSDIVEPKNACQHFQRVSTKTSVVKFSPQSFKDPSRYMNTKETAASVEAMKKYLTYQTNANPGLLDDIRQMFTMTAPADEIWHTDRITSYNSYTVWRYIGTFNGLIRVAPLVSFAKAYNPVYRTWYVRAMGQPGKRVFSSPYLDAFGAGFVVTLSHTLYKGNKDNKHSKTDTVIAVLGMDFTLTSFNLMIKETFPNCRDPRFQCYIIDDSGFLVIHEDFVHAKTKKIPELDYMHITVKDPDLARHLINGSYMKEQGCINFAKMRDQVSWKVDFHGKTVVEFKTGEPQYEVSAVGDSNIFVVIKKLATNKNVTQCSCISKSMDSVNSYQCKSLGTCQCPCYKNTSYLACEDKLVLTNQSYMNCPPKAPSLTIPPVTAQERTKAQSLRYCYQIECGKKNMTECMRLLGCSWCERAGSGQLLSKPYCASQEVCFFGVEGMPDPYNQAAPPPSTAPPKTTVPPPTTPESSPIGIIIGATIGGIVLITIIIIVTVLIVRHRQGKPLCPCCKKEEKDPLEQLRRIRAAQDNPAFKRKNQYENVEKFFDPVTIEESPQTFQEMELGEWSRHGQSLANPVEYELSYSQSTVQLKP